MHASLGATIESGRKPVNEIAYAKGIFMDVKY
jgi:hypothetical protein